MPPRFADMLGFLGSGSPELEASLTLGHCIIPFLCTLVVQIGTMKCFYCPQKDVSLVPWDLLSSADQAFLRDKYPDAGEGAVCEFCVRSARPSAFLSRRSSGSSSSGPQSVDSGLLVPAVEAVAVSGECEVAESSTSCKGVRCPESACKAFASRHLKEGQKTPCVENCYNCRGLNSTVSMVCMITTASYTVSHVVRRWMRLGRTHWQGTLSEGFMMPRVPRSFVRVHSWCLPQDMQNGKRSGR